LENTCNELLGYCLLGETWPTELLDRAIGVDEGRALLTVVVERLGDLFEPKLCRVYERLFTGVIERTSPELRSRLRKESRTGVRLAGLETGPTKRVYVLSRVTLGADVAVTSVLMDAAKRRFPDAEIVFVGPRKSFEMFEADPRLRHRDAPYARSGALLDRLRASAELWFDDGIVIDPDSRLTQLGLISVCDPDRYFFFESRSYGGDGDDALPTLAARWAREVFGVEEAHPYISPVAPREPPAEITVSLGVGENPAKRVDDNFERELLQTLAATGKSLLVDLGGTHDERERVLRALPPGARTHEGAFAPFAALIAKSKLFVGYDSAGGHVASACGVPLVSFAKGFVSPRMAARWRPNGTVIGEDHIYIPPFTFNT
jgi:hypothetical protein